MKNANAENTVHTAVNTGIVAGNTALKNEFCSLCGKSPAECICCPECGHLCALDSGGDYCEVCGSASSCAGEGC